jgi:ATP-dependent helicase/nuclease subunit A
MRALTAEQELAASRRRGSLLLSAGAGSGKTSVLVERFVRAVREDGIAPGRILAITFTERAAGELRERVRASLLELGEREAARDTEAAFISTFHGFCARLLRIHPLMAGLDPEFEILDEGRAGRLRLLAFRGALSGLLEGEREDAVDLVAAYGADRLRSMVLGAYAELRSRGQEEPRLPPYRPPSTPERAGGALRACLGEVIEELTRACQLRPGKRLEQALQVLERAESVFGVHDSATSGVVEPAIGVHSPGTLVALKLSGAASGALASPLCQIYREALAGYSAACADHYGERARVLLDGLLRDYSGRYGELKRERGAVDFDDLELRARGLLRERDDVRRGWSERLELMMVDEFQDTNQRQLEILEMLERDNLFTVGDEFQSIYGFRHADVSIFRERRRVLETQGASLALRSNFRSRPPLIDLINGVFGERLGSSYRPLLAGREDIPDQRESGSAQPSIELLLTDRRAWKEDSASTLNVGANLPDAPQWRQVEARLLAQRVAELVVEDGVEVGDVVVLLRALGDLPLYERALEDQGLRTLATVGSFWSQQQVYDLLAYLRVLANPLDEIAVYSTLASPLAGLSSDALALVALAARASGSGVWKACRGGHGDLVSRLSGGDAERMVAFVALVESERSQAPTRGVAEMILRVIALSGYEQHALSLPGGPRRRANIHKLVRLARRFEADEGRDLRGFLDHVAHQVDALEASEPEAPVADAEPDAVRLMSIHAAKGLEFPVVCVADLGRAPNAVQPDLLVDSQRVGLRLVGLDGGESVPALDYERICEQRREAEAEEEDRILYVAMTRARERLLLSGAVDFERWSDAGGAGGPAEVKPGEAPIVWLGPALVADLPDRARSLESPVQELTVGGGSPVRMRCWLNTPDTVGRVWRPEYRAGPRASPETGNRGPELGPSRETGNRRPELQLSLHTEDHRPDRARSALGASPEPPGLVVSRATSVGSPRRDPLATLSYTALGELERCGYRYYLERVLGLPENHQDGRGSTRGGWLEARSRGVLVHRLMESLDFVRPTAPSSSAVAAVAATLGLEAGPAECQEIAGLLSGALGSPLLGRVASAEGLRREQAFRFSLAAGERLTREQHMSGVLDLVSSEARGCRLVVDYKSDRVEEHTDLEALVEREYGVQRLLYALAVLRDGAQEVEVVHWFLARPDEWVGARFAADMRAVLEARLTLRIAEAREAEFAVSDTPHRSLCLTCPGRGTLCSWGEEQTLREQPHGEQNSELPGGTIRSAFDGA